jgi:tRNA dimethylallyltransferase
VRAPLGGQHRAYAKRQLTWFRADAAIRWHRPGEHAAMIAAARRFLAA